MKLNKKEIDELAEKTKNTFEKRLNASKYLPEYILHRSTSLIVETPTDFLDKCARDIRCNWKYGELTIEYYPEAQALAYVEKSRMSEFKVANLDTIREIVQLHNDPSKLKDYLVNLKPHDDAELSNMLNQMNNYSLRELAFRLIKEKLEEE